MGKQNNLEKRKNKWEIQMVKNNKIKKVFKKIGEGAKDVTDWGTDEWKKYKKYGREDKARRLKTEVEIAKLEAEKRKYDQSYERKTKGFDPFGFNEGGVGVSSKKKKNVKEERPNWL